MRVLVVEDEKKTASFIRKALQAEGLAVDVCHNRDEAWAAARATRFDAIVLDIMLPGRGSLSLLRQLHAPDSSCPWGKHPIAEGVGMCEKRRTNCASERRRGVGLCCRAAANPAAALFLRFAQERSFAIARRRSSIWKGLSRMASTGLSDSRSLSA